MEDDRPSPRQFFSKHAERFAKSKGHASDGDLALLMEKLAPISSETALDVATGMGFTAMELALKVKAVVAMDITEEMLAHARRLAEERGLKNIRFEEADASKLPYPDSSFDIVTSRRAPHHFSDIPRFLRESWRVLKVGGRLGIVDMSPPEGTEDFWNGIEQIRDPSHRQALTLSQWKRLVEEAGLSVVFSEALDKEVSFQEWMDPVQMGGREEALVRAEWNGATPQVREALGLRIADGRVEGWRKRLSVLVARKP